MNLGNVLETALLTDTGRARTHNEDAVASDAEVGVAVLADGMGGYNAGEVASGIAVALVASELRQGVLRTKLHGLEQAEADRVAIQLLASAVAKANTSIYETANRQPHYAGMGTTLVAAVLRGDRLTVAHVGDSRMYMVRDEKLSQITKDHSLLQEQIDIGMITKEAARRSLNKNLVTRALGIEPEVTPEIHTYDVYPGDIFLLCSDGLNDMVEDEDIELALNSLCSNLPLAASQLVDMANDNGGRDNISVVLLKLKRESPPRETWLGKVVSRFK